MHWSRDYTIDRSSSGSLLAGTVDLNSLNGLRLGMPATPLQKCERRPRTGAAHLYKADAPV